MKRIIIIGGGFGGVKCARTLRRTLRSRDAEIVLFNRENHLVFSPLLADAVGSSLNLMDVVVPLRQLLPEVVCRTEEVRGVDLAGRTVEYQGFDGQTRRLAYDHVVFACGNVSNLNVVPGMADHAYPLKTVGDAAVLRTHVLQQMERAEVCDDPERRRWHLSFIIVGGGYSGVEAAGEINDLVRGSLRFFHNIRGEDVTVTLVHSRDQLLPEIGAPLREFAARKMRRAGVALRLNARVMLATGEGVGLKDGFVPGATIVCTIGSTTAPVIERLEAPKEKGRLRTEPDLSLPGHPEAWAVGDCALITNGHDGLPCPPTGQFAERQGRQCALNIARTLQGEARRPFAFRVLGQLCSIGGHSAVAELFGLRLSGFWAWFVWRGVYLFKLPSWSRRIQVGFDWAWLLLFPRDLSHIKTEVTDRVTHAHFEPGDWIIRRGEPPSSFYVIERGEVEVVKPTPDHPEGAVIATLGAGNFFGEQALVNNRPRSASVRARTPVEIVVMGRNVFGHISRSLAPLRQALTAAIARRSTDFWPERPAVQAALQTFRLDDFIEPCPRPLLRPTATLAEVARQFADESGDLLYVSADGARLDGLISLTDLLQTQAAVRPPETPLADFMCAQPVAVAASDSMVVVAAAFREYGHNTLPVVDNHQDRRLVGLIRVRRVIARILQVVPPPSGQTHPPVGS